MAYQLVSKLSFVNVQHHHKLSSFSRCLFFVITNMTSHYFRPFLGNLVKSRNCLGSI